MKSLLVHHMKEIVFFFLVLQCLFASFLISFLRKGGVASSCSMQPIPAMIHGLRLRHVTWSDVASAIIFITCLVIYGWLMVDHVDLSWPDHSHITKELVSGELWMQINPANGRFSPMVHQEFLIFSLFAKRAVDWYLISICYLALITLAMLLTISFDRLLPRIILISSVLFSTCFAGPISGLIFPEINIILCSLIFLFLEIRRRNIEHGDDGQSLHPRDIALLAIVTYLIYLKELFFVFFTCYSISSVLGYFLARNTIRDSGRADKLRNFLATFSMEAAYTIISIIYFLIYYFLIYRHTKIPYAGESNGGVIETMNKMVHASPLLLIVGTGLLFRIARILGNPRTFLPVWDPFAFSMGGYVGVLLYHGLWFDYYYLPFIFFSIIYIPTIMRLDQTKFLKVIYIGASLLVMVISIPKTLLFFQNRELFMQSRNMAVKRLNELNKSHIGKVFYLEGIKGYDSEEFIYYARFKGVNISREKETPLLTGPQVDGTVLIPLAVDPKQDVSTRQLREKALQAGYNLHSNDIIISLPNLSGTTVRVTVSDDTSEQFTPWNMTSLSQKTSQPSFLKRMLFASICSHCSGSFESLVYVVN